MHPAYSVIIFTCASGAGYGLLVWFGLTALAAGSAALSRPMIIAGFLVAFLLISAGLVSSTLHLGRPERAWRAFSQWRSSWLSREGVMAVVTYPIAALFGIGWLAGVHMAPAMGAFALLTIVSALATLWCTGMIYASLPTIRAWHKPHVAPLYVLLGLATGGLVYCMLGTLVDGAAPRFALWGTLLVLAISALAKWSYWTTIDAERRTHTTGDATGLGRFGTVRVLEPPHTNANYVMREMGYDVARNHARRLRRYSMLGLFAIPALSLIALLAFAGAGGIVLSMTAVAAAAAGVLTERWLFFAEAEHVVMIYYGRAAA